MAIQKWDEKKHPERRSSVQNIVFGAILIILFVLVCRLFAPFFTAFLWSVLLYIIFSPLHKRAVSKLNDKKLSGKILLSVWACVFSLGTVILILLPLYFVGFQFFRQITDLLYYIRDYLVSHSGQEILGNFLEDISRRIEDISSGQIIISASGIRSRILVYLSQSLQSLLQFSRNIVMNIGSFLAGLVLMLFILFFFYMDGPYLLRIATRVIPIKQDYMQALVNKFKEITKNLLTGYLLAALLEALFAFIIFSVFQIKGSLVFAALIFICAFLPMIGGSVVWVPLGIIRIAGGDVRGGIMFCVVSGIFISALDNFLRLVVLKDHIQLHPLIIFFAMLGGIIVFGFNGIILGPMVVILFLTVLDLFLSEHKIEDKEPQVSRGGIEKKSEFRHNEP